MSDAHVLALDVGERRIGIAMTSLAARLPAPFGTWPNDEAFVPKLRALIKEKAISTIVIGLPRGLDGQETAQTRYARDFATTIEALGISVQLQDEAGTSVQATEELEARQKPYSKADIDALAATYILEDFVRDHVDASKGSVR